MIAIIGVVGSSCVAGMIGACRKVFSRSNLLSKRCKTSSVYPPAWTTLAKKEIGNNQGPDSLEWKTPEGIVLKPLYTEADVNPNADVTKVATPGVFPYARGPYATM